MEQNVKVNSRSISNTSSKHVRVPSNVSKDSNGNYDQLYVPDAHQLSDEENVV